MLISGIFWFMNVNFTFFPNTESNFFEVNSKAPVYISMYLQTHIYTSYFTHRSYNNQFSTWKCVLLQISENSNMMT